MSNNKQSSLEWFWFNLTDDIIGKLSSQQIGEIYELIQQAKKMHKKEHSKTWDKSMDNLDLRGGNIARAWDDFDEYYNETFKK